MEAPDIIRAPFGTSHELQCVATGDPPPLISWLKDGRTVIDAPSNRNIHFNNQNKQFRTVHYTINGESCRDRLLIRDYSRSRCEIWHSKITHS